MLSLKVTFLTRLSSREAAVGSAEELSVGERLTVQFCVFSRRELLILRLGKGDAAALFVKGVRGMLVAFAAAEAAGSGMGISTFEKVHCSFEGFFHQTLASSHPLANCLAAAEGKGEYFFGHGNKIFSLAANAKPNALFQLQEPARIEALASRSSILAAATQYGDCFLFQRGKEIGCLKDLQEKHAEAGQICLSIDSGAQFLAIAGKRTRTCRVYALQDPDFPLVWRMKFTKIPRAIAFTKIIGNELSVAVAFESCLEIHSLSSKSVIRQFPLSNSPITALATNAQFVAIGCKDGTCTLFGGKEGERLCTVNSVSSPIHSQVDFIAFGEEAEGKALWVASFLAGEVGIVSSKRSIGGQPSPFTADSRILGLVCEEGGFSCISLNHSFFEVKAE